jgi:hypothetical protein
MAVRPSLVEQAVLAIQLQTVIPSAEPPLGATTQLILALIMAGIGGVLGAILARRIGRPRATISDRKRNAASAVNSDSPTANAFGLRSEGMDHELGKADTTILRRRQLAMQEDTSPRDYQERAPLPGGSPQILNVSEFDLEGFEADRQEPIQEFVSETNELADKQEVEAPEAPASVQVFGATNETNDDEDVEFGQPDNGTIFTVAAQSEEGSDAAAFDVSDDESSSDDTISGQFDSEVAGDHHDGSDETVSNQPAEKVGRLQLFAQEIDPREQEADSGIPDIRDPDWSSEDGEDTGESPSPYDAATTNSLFSQPSGDALDAPDAIYDALNDDRAEEPETSEAAVDPDAENELPEEWFGVDGHAADPDELAALSNPATVEAEEEYRVGDALENECQADDDTKVWASTPTSRIMSANLNELSHAELLERLALTLERSRNHQAATALVPVADQLEPEETQAETTYPIDRDELAVEAPQEFSAPTAANDSREPMDNTIAASAVEQHDETLEDVAAQRFVPPPPGTIPAALRPIDLDDDADTELLPGMVPPRHFSMTATLDNPPHQFEAGQAEDEERHVEGTEPDIGEAAQAREFDEDGNLAEDERELEEGYSSLLSLSRPDRQQFVRIEEAEVDDGEIRPFVVFPSEDAASPGPFTKPQVNADLESASADLDHGALPPSSETEGRRFDRPENAKDMAKGDAATTPQQDPEETERSLKAALATLQRMSGAA